MYAIKSIPQEEKIVEIKDNSKRAKSLIIIFWSIVGLAFLGVLSGYHEFQLLKKIKFGEIISDREAALSDAIQSIIGIAQTGIHLVSMVVFLSWFRRAYGNLHRVGIPDLKHQESMAVWAWFIPIIWFYRPAQIMNEIWTETQEKIKKSDASYIIKSGGLIIGLWWTLFILSSFIGRYTIKTAFKEDTIEHIIESSRAMLIADMVHIPEALLVLFIVYKLSDMETKLAYEIKKSAGEIVR